MAVTLGGVALSDHLILEGLETSPGVSIFSNRTLGGSMVSVPTQLDGGRTLTLSGENHFTLGEIEAVKSLEALGQTVTLEHHRGSFSVLITNVDVTPTQYADPVDDDWLSGTITMIEV